MSEKRRREILAALERDLTDRGLLIEAGWAGLQRAAIPSGAPQVQLDEMRSAFFAGAQHLFGSIMRILEPGADPTEADFARMLQISDELDRFAKQFAERYGLSGAQR